MCRAFQNAGSNTPIESDGCRRDASAVLEMFDGLSSPPRNRPFMDMDRSRSVGLRGIIKLTTALQRSGGRCYHYLASSASTSSPAVTTAPGVTPYAACVQD